jgi:hypothetical protein
VSRSRRARAGPNKAETAGELAIKITIMQPDGESAAELRERQFAAIMRLLRRAYEQRQQRARAA